MATKTVAGQGWRLTDSSAKELFTSFLNGTYKKDASTSYAGSTLHKILRESLMKERNGAESRAFTSIAQKMLGHGDTSGPFNRASLDRLKQVLEENSENAAPLQAISCTVKEHPGRNVLFSIKCGQRLKGNIIVSEETFETNFVVVHGAQEDLDSTASSSFEIFKNMSIFAQIDLKLAAFKDRGLKHFLYTVCWILCAADNVSDFDRGLGLNDIHTTDATMLAFPDKFTYRKKLAPKRDATKVVHRSSKKRKFDDVEKDGVEDGAENPRKRNKKLA